MSVAITKIKKQFADRVVLNDLSYTFSDRGAYALVGNSGSGKTTLLRLLAGLESPDEGTLTVEGSVAVCFQEYRLLDNLSVLDNLLLVLYKKPTEKERQAALSLLERLSLCSYAHSYPHELSGGMKQRVSLARAFLSNAPILLLDEPIKELDSTLAGEVISIIREEAERRLVIFTAHDVSLPMAVGANILEINS